MVYQHNYIINSSSPHLESEYTYADMAKAGDQTQDPLNHHATCTDSVCNLQLVEQNQPTEDLWTDQSKLNVYFFACFAQMF